MKELKAFYCFIADGTGFGYSETFKLSLLKPLLKGLEFRAKYFLGDAYYGRVEVLKGVKELRLEAIVPLRETIRKKVKDSYRLWAKENYERRREVYRKNRFRVEQVIGIVKNRFLRRFALYNLILLYKLLLLYFFLLLSVCSRKYCYPSL